MKAEAELASLYRERAIARAWAAGRDPKKRAAGSGGSKCETGRCPGRWLDASINDLETLTRS